MANAARDDNGVTTLVCASNADGTTIVPVYADPTLHYLKTSDGTTGSDHGTTNAQRDNNFIPVVLGVSSSDGVTPVEIYADGSTNAILTKST